MASFETAGLLMLGAAPENQNDGANLTHYANVA